MFIRQIVGLGVQSRLLVAPAIFAHTKTCPSKKQAVCPGSKGKGGGQVTTSKANWPKRAEKSGKVRLGFVPEEWFLFFHSKTGVSGPYVFGLVLANYLCSKEIYILEHEFYLGLSILVILVLATKHLGPDIAAWLDKEVDDIVNEYEQGRKEDKLYYENIIKEAKAAQWRAEGQKLLMDAKKENIAMQIEAIYRERLMHVHRMVKGRMDYHLKRYQSEARIHQKWMIGWILENVRKSITPEFEKQALDRAIQDLAEAASRAK